MIKSFKDRGTEDIFKGRRTAYARRTCPPEIWDIAVRKLYLLHSAERLDELRVISGMRLKAMKGKRKSEISIRINHQYRVCLSWAPGGAVNVAIEDYH